MGRKVHAFLDSLRALDITPCRITLYTHSGCRPIDSTTIPDSPRPVNASHPGRDEFPVHARGSPVSEGLMPFLLFRLVKGAVPGLGPVFDGCRGKGAGLFEAMNTSGAGHHEAPLMRNSRRTKRTKLRHASPPWARATGAPKRVRRVEIFISRPSAQASSSSRRS
jgi:hypothetical protein